MYYDGVGLLQNYINSSGVGYKVVILANISLVIKGKFNLKKILKQSTLNETNCLIPEGNDYENGICHILTIANYNVICKIASIYEQLRNYAAGGVLIHPEQMFKRHLNMLNINVQRFEANVSLSNWQIASFDDYEIALIIYGKTDEVEESYRVMKDRLYENTDADIYVICPDGHFLNRSWKKVFGERLMKVKGYDDSETDAVKKAKNLKLKKDEGVLEHLTDWYNIKEGLRQISKYEEYKNKQYDLVLAMDASLVLTEDFCPELFVSGSEKLYSYSPKMYVLTGDLIEVMQGYPDSYGYKNNKDQFLKPEEQLHRFLEEKNLKYQAFPPSAFIKLDEDEVKTYGTNFHNSSRRSSLNKTILKTSFGRSGSLGDLYASEVKKGLNVDLLITGDLELIQHNYENLKSRLLDNHHVHVHFDGKVDNENRNRFLSNSQELDSYDYKVVMDASVIWSKAFDLHNLSRSKIYKCRDYITITPNASNNSNSKSKKKKEVKLDDDKVEKKPNKKAEKKAEKKAAKAEKKAAKAAKGDKNTGEIVRDEIKRRVKNQYDDSDSDSEDIVSVIVSELVKDENVSDNDSDSCDEEIKEDKVVELKVQNIPCRVYDPENETTKMIKKEGKKSSKNNADDDKDSKDDSDKE